ncbi:peptide-methionine (S)-S-oxide reductase [Sporosarcina sp. P18a]|nr:peptide-methionine (S)-S-oxide reductase MsrA [Sporosarcina sp. P18a]PIC78658.1 peptide-methionine (S)-S-oxide reductase [Sporosarcina sp. P18a]
MLSMVEQNFEKAAFAGGCFWCMVKPFKEWPGVQDVVSGYMGGHLDNPTYEDVKKGASGHVEVVEITFDPALFPYEKLLEVYWQQIDPTDAEGQFHDRGSSYTTAIFYYTEAQREAAKKSKADLAASGIFTKPIVTTIRPAETFYRAEEYHQDYYIKEQEHYKDNRARSGRNEFIAEHWSK